jgi:hypothetical protein
MKKFTLVLLSFVPIVVGYIVNITLLLPVIGMLSFYVLPLLTTAFWFYLGRQYARTDWKTIPAILIGNTAGIISMLVYLWQRVLVTEEARNVTLTGASQMFSSSAPTYLLARVALLFERQPNYIGSASMVALQVVSLVYMIAVFCVGMLWEKKRTKTESAK